MTKVIDVADEFLRLAARSGKKISPISLMKLCIIANGWHLAHQGEALFEEPVEAWAHGPAVDALYQVLKRFDGTAPHRDQGAPTRVAQDAAKTIAMTFASYGDLPQSTLQGLTNREGSPWAIARSLSDAVRAIPRDLIRDHYLALEAQRAKKAA